jgi:hypothetical protein
LIEAPDGGLLVWGELVRVGRGRGSKCDDPRTNSRNSAPVPSMGLWLPEMPSFSHEALLDLFRRRPTLAPELLRDALHVSMPPFDHVQVGDSDVSEILPTERKADLVLLFSDLPGGAPQRALVVEVQLAIDTDKQRSWWWYLVGIHTRHRCDVTLVVVTPSAPVAEWARKPLGLGHPGVSLRPVVIGPDTVPVVRDAEEARRSPELAVLSAMVHGRSEAGESIAKAAIAAVRDLDEERSTLYTDVVLASLHAAARKLLEDLMTNGTYQYQSDFAKRYFGQGKAEGRAEGRALAILALLAARSVDVPPEVRERMLACTDVALLDTWIVRAANAKEVREVVGE